MSKCDRLPVGLRCRIHINLTWNFNSRS